MRMSRRGFLKASSALAAAFGLRAVGGNVAFAAEEDSSVVWLQAQGCSGCSMSLLNSLTGGTVEDLLQRKVRLAFHPTLMAAAGPNAIAQARAARDAGGYILIVEGAVPTEAGGRFCYLWPGTTALDGVREFASKAKHVVAVGTCAAYGGIPGSVPPAAANPTGAKGLSAVLSGRAVINIPGCPTHPDWIVGTVASLLGGVVPARDANGRPEMYFSNTIHNQCPYEDSYAEKFCLEEDGCKGPITYGNCPAFKWNNAKPGGIGVNWCVGARSPCQGCTQPDFPDGMLPFHQEVEE